MKKLITEGVRPVRPGAPSLVVLWLLAIGLLATGCGLTPSGSPPEPREGSVPPVGPTSPPATVDGTPSAPPGPGLVEVVAGQRERQVPWRFVREVDGPAIVVEGQIGGPPCDVVTGVDVDESDETVEVTVWAGREPGASCHGVPAALATFHLRVELDAPLGSRTPRPSAAG